MGACFPEKQVQSTIIQGLNTIARIEYGLLSLQIFIVHGNFRKMLMCSPIRLTPIDSDSEDSRQSEYQ